MCIAKRNLLDISEIHATSFTFTNHLGAFLCILHGVVEDRRFLRVVFEAITVSLDINDKPNVSKMFFITDV